MSKKRVVYVGSFDPITNGHLDIIERLSQSFDEVTVLISSSLQKKYLFNLKERKKLVADSCKHLKGAVIVDSWDGLLVEYMKKNKIKILAKGLRNSRDFDYEIVMDQTNKSLYPETETIYLISRAELSFVSSTLVKEIAALKGSVSNFVPAIVKKELELKFK